MRALRTGVNIADPERSSPAYEHRLAKYSLRGFAVAVPGLELAKVARRYRSGIFSWVGKQRLRRIELTFGGGDTPVYTVHPSEVVGLPKLLVLAALRTYKTANQASKEGEDQSDGAFLISLEKLGEYGADSDEVWKKPSPPACPPRKLLVNCSAPTRAPMLATTNEHYAEILLPFAEGAYPSSVESHVQAFANDADDGIKLCYEFIEDVSTVGGFAAAAPRVQDAAAREPELFSRSTTGLPRYIEFTPSNAAGVPNPFARSPAEDWFGDVYDD